MLGTCPAKLCSAWLSVFRKAPELCRRSLAKTPNAPAESLELLFRLKVQWEYVCQCALTSANKNVERMQQLL